MDPRLEQLYSELPNYCLKAKAQNTRRKYRYAYEHFSNWCTFFNPVLLSLPASEKTVAMYVAHLAQTYNSESKLQEATYAISWFHNIAGFTDPCDSFLVNQVKEGAIRDVAKPTSKKLPISADHLNSLVRLLANDDSSLYDLRTVSMCLVGFAGFLRFSEISNIKRNDITFFENHVCIFLPQSKTDKHKKGSSVNISKSHSLTCPVTILRRYLEKADIGEFSDEFIFRQLSFFQKGEQI